MAIKVKSARSPTTRTREAHCIALRLVLFFSINQQTGVITISRQSRPQREETRSIPKPKETRLRKKVQNFRWWGSAQGKRAGVLCHPAIQTINAPPISVPTNES